MTSRIHILAVFKRQASAMDKPLDGRLGGPAGLFIALGRGAIVFDRAGASGRLSNLRRPGRLGAGFFDFGRAVLGSSVPNKSLL